MTQTQTAPPASDSLSLYDLIMQELEPNLLEARVRDGTAWKRQDGETDDDYAARITRYRDALDTLQNILDHLERSEEVASARSQVQVQRRRIQQEDQSHMEELEQMLS